MKNQDFLRGAKYRVKLEFDSKLGYFKIVKLISKIPLFLLFEEIRTDHYHAVKWKNFKQN